jgi:hypothetical protein
MSSTVSTSKSVEKEDVMATAPKPKITEEAKVTIDLAKSHEDTKLSDALKVFSTRISEVYTQKVAKLKAELVNEFVKHTLESNINIQNLQVDKNMIEYSFQVPTSRFDTEYGARGVFNPAWKEVKLWFSQHNIEVEWTHYYNQPAAFSFTIKVGEIGKM